MFFAGPAHKKTKKQKNQQGIYSENFLQMKKILSNAMTPKSKVPPEWWL